MMLFVSEINITLNTGQNNEDGKSMSMMNGYLVVPTNAHANNTDNSKIITLDTTENGDRDPQVLPVCNQLSLPFVLQYKEKANEYKFRCTLKLAMSLNYDIYNALLKIVFRRDLLISRDNIQCDISWKEISLEKSLINELNLIVKPQKRLEKLERKLTDEFLVSVGALDSITHIKPIDNITSTYTIGKPLGVGGSCRVVVGHLTTDKTSQVAMKIIDKELPVAEFLYKREVSLLHYLTNTSGFDDENPPTVPFIGHGEDHDSYYIITKLLTGGEIMDRLLSFKAIQNQNNNEQMTETKAINMVKQILLSLKFCHDRNIAHRDVNPENLLNATTDPDSSIVLIDFGSSVIVEDDEVLNDVRGTVYFMSPELAITRLEYYRSKGRELPPGIGNKYKSSDRTGKILRAGDVWAVGVIAYMLVTGHRPFRGHNNLAIFASIVKDKLLFPRTDGRYDTELILNPQFIDFTQKLMCKDALQRPTVDECLQHPWLRDIDKDNNEYQLNADVLKFLKQFKQQTDFKKEVTRLVSQDMTDSATTKHMVAHFQRLDNDGDGYLNEYEINVLLLDMGYNKYEAKKQAKLIIESNDHDNDGKLNLNEFMQSWYRKVLLKSNDAILQSVFDVFDKNGDGYIDTNELNDVLFNKDKQASNINDIGNDKKVQEDGNEEDDDDDDRQKFRKIQTLIEEVDLDGDGKISFDEFKQAMKEDIDIEANGFKLSPLSYGDMVGVKYDQEYDLNFE